MKTKEKTRRPTESRAREGSIYSDLKFADMTAIDRKIYDLLIAEGYQAAGAQRFEGTKLNNYTNVDRREYIRREHERFYIMSTHRQEPKETA